MAPFTLRTGTAPLLVSMPHTGVHVPADIFVRFTPAARALPDTDWHLERLYDFLDALGASVLVATHSRYVIDLNRPADDASLYPGSDTTGLIPVDTFAREAVYDGPPPDAIERARRLAGVWQPFHDALAGELERLRAAHGYALLWDAHSIISKAPRFFDGRLMDFNLGTADGRSCGAGLGEHLLGVARASTLHSAVLNGRFKGGHITRAYGNPARNVHAVQMELSEITYMDEAAPFVFREHLAAQVRPQLHALLEAMLDWCARTAQA